MNEAPFKIFFWTNKAKSYTKSEGLDVVNYIGLHDVYSMEKRVEYLLESCNI